MRKKEDPPPLPKPTVNLEEQQREGDREGTLINLI